MVFGLLRTITNVSQEVGASLRVYSGCQVAPKNRQSALWR